MQQVHYRWPYQPYNQTQYPFGTYPYSMQANIPFQQKYPNFMPYNNPYPNYPTGHVNNGFHPSGQTQYKQPPFENIMNTFKDENGNIDFNKMMNTYQQLSSAVKQISPIVKAIGPFFKSK